MALSTLRKGSRGIGGKLILVLIIFSFAIWGVSNVFNNNATTVAVVGGVKIPTRLFQAEYERTIQRLSNERGQRVSVTQAKREGVPQGVLSSMVVRQAVENHAASLGITTSDREAIKQIMSIEAFDGILGEFDEAKFVDTLNRSGFTRGEFEDNVRNDVTREQMTNAIVSGMSLPRGLAETMVRNRLQRRNASYIVLAPDLAGQIAPPSEEVLRGHYQEKIFSYTSTEYRDISFIALGPQDFTGGIDVPEEDIKDLYERRLSVFTTPETRNIERLFGSQDDMIAAKARINAGESFAAVGSSLGLSADEVELGDIGERGITDTVVAKAAFEADGPGLIGPVEGLSWSLVRVNSIEEESTTSYEDARTELREELVLREADRTLGDNIEIIDEAIASGDPLESVASKIGLALKSVKRVDAAGIFESGGVASDLPDDDKLIKEAFASVQNFDSDLIEFGENQYFVVRVDEIYPAAARPFEAVRSKVETSWSEIERESRLTTLAAGIIDRAAGGDDFAKLGQEVGRNVIEVPGGLGRNQVTDIFSQSLIGKLFNARDGEYFYASVDLGESLVVMRMDSVIDVEDEAMLAVVDMFKQQLDAGLANDAERQYLNAVRMLYDTNENAQAISLAIGDVPQQQNQF